MYNYLRLVCFALAVSVVSVVPSSSKDDKVYSETESVFKLDKDNRLTRENKDKKESNIKKLFEKIKRKVKRISFFNKKEIAFSYDKLVESIKNIDNKLPFDEYKNKVTEAFRENIELRSLYKAIKSGKIDGLNYDPENLSHLRLLNNFCKRQQLKKS